jgi:hypothetical protein
MSRRNGLVPAYRLHKASGQSRVIIRGKRKFVKPRPIAAGSTPLAAHVEASVLQGLRVG